MSMDANTAFALGILTEDELTSALAEARAHPDRVAVLWPLGNPGIIVGLPSLLVERELRQQQRKFGGD
jgi:hypothetical protein